MKKSILAISCFLISLATIAQSGTKVATYDGSTKTISVPLDHDYYFQIADSFGVIFGGSDYVIDSVVIDDEDPTVIDSIAYLTFYVSSEREGGFAIGFPTTKFATEEGNTDYYIDPGSGDEQQQQYAARSWKCTHNGDCTQCKPDRNWFLGPVVGCKCNQCIFDSGGDGIPWSDIIHLVVAILGLF